MKILNAKQLSEVDQYTMKKQGLADWELMERASYEATTHLLQQMNITDGEIYIFCGTSNNGGDGLAIARMLHQKKASIKVFNVIYSTNTSAAHQKNLALLNDLNIPVHPIKTNKDLPKLGSPEFIIDAIFGVGLNRKMPDFIQQFVQQINQCNAKVIAIDVPSGMYLEKSVAEGEHIINSDVCLTFQLPKLPFLIPSTGVFVENFKLIDIGLSVEKIEQIDSPYHYLTNAVIQPILKKRKKFSHKGTYGNAFLIGGQQGMHGSVIMSSIACLRSGVGKVYTHLDPSGQNALMQHSLETIYVENCLASLTSESQFNAIGIGMGLGKSNQAFQLLNTVIQEQSCRLLLDADAINLLSEHPNLLKILPENTVLTPHLGELKRLLGSWRDDFELLQKVKEFCTTFHLVLIVKGAHSFICDGHDFYFNSSGNPSLAKAGTGDVLAGIITALLAQNYSVLEACKLGVYVHGFSADMIRKDYSEHSIIATDVIKQLPKAFRKLEN